MPTSLKTFYLVLFFITKLFKSETDDLGFCPISEGLSSCETDVDDDGGWKTDTSKIIANAGPCNIDVLTSLTQEDFIEKYAYKAPFVVKNHNENLKFRTYSRKENMLKEFGDRSIRLSSANTHSYEKLDVSLKHYVTDIMKPQTLETPGNETFYWFGDNDHLEWEEVFSSYRPPDLHVPNLGPALSYGVADVGTGVPFHFHGPGFSEVIFGSKRWFLYPPQNMPHFNPNLTTLHWLVHEYPHLSEDAMPMECTLKPGEVIYFPDRWWHATLNINAGVFVSTFLG